MRRPPAVVTLQAEAAGAGELAFRSMDLLPDRAMMVYQIRANLPGSGEIDVLTAPPLDEGLSRFGRDDINGNASFSMGAAFLAPFVNRIRGRLLPGSHEIETRIAGRLVRLPANGGGKARGAERYAIHGLILDRAAVVTDRLSCPGGQRVRARLDAGNFEGRWLSQTAFEFDIRLVKSEFAATVRAINLGDEPLPIGLGWHPYFNLPSGLRAQARMKIRAKARLAVNDYDEVLPTGQILPVRGTPYDFADGRPLGDLYLDDCFVGLAKDDAGQTICEVMDPAASYGLQVISDSPEITAVQTYAPPDRPLVVIEPQFSWADPYGDEWPEGVETGMVLLQPGQSVEYRVRLKLFRP